METQIGTAVAEGTTGRQAGERAARQALAELPDDRVDFCQVFCSVAYDYEAVLAGIRSVVGDDAALVGCSTATGFTDETVADDAVALGLVASDTVSFHTSIGTGLSDSVSRAVREAVTDLPDAVEDHPYLAAITLHDGLAGVGEELSLVSQQKLGPKVTVAGGAAADDHQLEATHVFHGETVTDDAVVFALVAAKERPVVAIDHGHVPLSDPVEVTDSEGSLVHELDGRPAFAVWRDAVRDSVREEFGVDVDDLERTSQLLGRIMCEYEFGIDQGGDYKMRWPWVSPETGDTLNFAVDVPEGTVLRVMHGAADAQVESGRRTARAAVERAGDTELAGAFVYDCACRGIVLSEAFGTAVDAMADELDGPFVGFETYGEVCMGPEQLSGFHNTTTVVLALPR
jgi:methyl-accepting chemotaxis protein